jgi:HEPN domain-containing protein
VNRVQAREFAEAWVIDAKALLDAARWHAAYYLAGYAVECGLKACILAHIENTGIIFHDKKFAERCFTHDIEALVKAANLEIIRGLDIASSPDLALNWQVVKDWNVDIRYEERSEREARELYEAITHSAHGVLPWIKARW